MSKRRSKKAVKPAKAAAPGPWLRKALAKRTKAELIDLLLNVARDEPTVLRRLSARFEVKSTPRELITATRQAIAAATAFDEREINYNFSYDYEAYEEVQRNLQRLVELGQLRPAMELLLELMAKGSYQAEMSDEALMTDEIEVCVIPVLKALPKCDLPAAEMIAWCTAMLKRDRVGYICDSELRALRQQLEAS